MNYYPHYPQQEYDPSSQNQQFYDHTTNSYYSYSYANPQYATVNPYHLTVQPSQHDDQEPNPPGVTPVPAPEQVQASYYQFSVGPQQGAVDTGVAGVHQPIVQSSYSGIGIASGADAQIHLGHTPNVTHQPHHVHGLGRGHLLHMNAPAPHIQGVPLQSPSQSYAESHLAPGHNVSGRSYRGRGRGSGRGRGRGRGRALHKHAAPSALEQKVFVQGGSDSQGGPSLPVSQSVAPSFGQIPMPFQGLPQSAPVLPSSKAVCCELCRVECNTVEILKQHMSGKKHLKKLKVFEELQNLNKRAICQIEQPSTSELKTEVPSQPDQGEESGNQQLKQEAVPSQGTNEESKSAVEEQKVEEVQAAEEPAKKARTDNSGGVRRGLKRKMRGGKSSRKTRAFDRPKRVVEPPKPKEVIPLVCELCNVKCESLVVFQSHLVGKKHHAKAKRFLGHEAMLGQEPLQPQGPALQALGLQSANVSTSIVSQVQDPGFGTYQVTSAQNAMMIIQASNKGQPETGGSSLEQSAIVPSNAHVSLSGEGTVIGQVQSNEMKQPQ